MSGARHLANYKNICNYMYNDECLNPWIEKVRVCGIDMDVREVSGLIWA